MIYLFSLNPYNIFKVSKGCNSKQQKWTFNTFFNYAELISSIKLLKITERLYFMPKTLNGSNIGLEAYKRSKEFGKRKQTNYQTKTK